MSSAAAAECESEHLCLADAIATFGGSAEETRAIIRLLLACHPASLKNPKRLALAIQTEVDVLALIRKHIDGREAPGPSSGPTPDAERAYLDLALTILSFGGGRIAHSEVQANCSAVLVASKASAGALCDILTVVDENTKQRHAFVHSHVEDTYSDEQKVAFFQKVVSDLTSLAGVNAKIAPLVSFMTLAFTSGPCFPLLFMDEVRTRWQAPF